MISINRHWQNRESPRISVRDLYLNKELKHLQEVGVIGVKFTKHDSSISLFRRSPVVEFGHGLVWP